MAKKIAKKAPKKSAKKTAPDSSSSTGPLRQGEGGPMHLPLLEKLTALMAEHDLTNIELQDGEQKIILNRGHYTASAPAPATPQAVQAPQPPAAPQAAPAAAPSAPAAKADDTAGLAEITSPMVGTYYARPSPDAKAFVDVGSKVGADTDVCIIEAMKVFNTIKAETSGTIEKALVKDGDAVEFGQVLFLVKPS